MTFRIPLTPFTRGNYPLEIIIPPLRIIVKSEDISGLRHAFINGKDPFTMFIEEAKTVIDFCIDHEFASLGNIAVCGTSRAGYLALRLLGEDNRIAAAAAFAPVTDWRYLEEFEADQTGKTWRR